MGDKNEKITSLMLSNRRYIDTLFGTIENHNYVIQPLPKDGLAFDLFVTSVVNIDQANDILINAS